MLRLLSKCKSAFGARFAKAGIGRSDVPLFRGLNVHHVEGTALALHDDALELALANVLDKLFVAPSAMAIDIACRFVERAREIACQLYDRARSRRVLLQHAEFHFCCPHATASGPWRLRPRASDVPDGALCLGHDNLFSETLDAQTLREIVIQTSNSRVECSLLGIHFADARIS
jgi:hypothetical protein